MINHAIRFHSYAPQLGMIVIVKFLLLRSAIQKKRGIATEQLVCKATYLDEQD
jgi:hypothetical protein